MDTDEADESWAASGPSSAHVTLESWEVLAIVNCLALVVDQVDDGPFHAMIGVDRSATDELRARLSRTLKSLLPLAPEGTPIDRGGTS